MKANMTMMVSIYCLMDHTMTIKVTSSTKKDSMIMVAFMIKKRENTLTHMNSSRKTTKNSQTTTMNSADQAQRRKKTRKEMAKTRTTIPMMRKTITTFLRMKPTRASGENIASQLLSGLRINQKIR